MKTIIKKIGLFITNVVRSLDTVQNSGYSARKLTGLGAFIVGVYITVKLLPPEALLHALYAWLLVLLLCLSIVTVEQIIKFKTGANADKPKD